MTTTTLPQPHTGTYLHTFHHQHGFYTFVTPGDSVTEFKAAISHTWDGKWAYTITTYGQVQDHGTTKSLASAKSHVIAVYNVAETAATWSD